MVFLVSEVNSFDIVYVQELDELGSDAYLMRSLMQTWTLAGADRGIAKISIEVW